MTMKKWGAGLLALLLFLLPLAACKSKGDKPQKPEENTATGEQDPFSEIDLGGDTVTVMCMKESGGGGSLIDSYNELYTVENGDIINDAIFQRYEAMQENLNCALNVLSVGSKSNLGTTLRDYNMNGEAEKISAVLIVGKSLPAIINTGDLIDLSTVNTVDLSHDWWVQSGVADMTVGGKCYAAPGNASVYGLTAMACIYFNKDILRDNQKDDNLYNDVREGTWTFGRMAELATELACELDGQDGTSIDDRIGFVAEYGYLSYLFTATGKRTISIGEDKKVTVTASDSATTDFIDQFLTLYTNQTVTKIPVRDYGDDYTLVAKNFMAKKAMFYAHFVFDALDLRGMKGDFGMLPTPKASAEQEQYYSGVNRWLSSYTVIPRGCSNSERGGVIAEALNYYGKEYIREAIYTKSFDSGRSVCDVNSIEMFNLIVETQVHDPGLLLSTTVYDLFSSVAWSGIDTFASSLKKRSDAFAEEMETIFGQ